MQWSSFRGVSEESLTKICVGLVALIASSVLLGWFLDLPVLKSIVPGYITMKANTALCFLCLSATLWLLQKEKTHVIKKRLGAGLSFLVMAIAILTLGEYLVDSQFGIDELLFIDFDGKGGRFPPGRLAPITAIIFILLSLSFLLANVPKKPLYRVSQFLVGLSFAASLQGLVGYLIGLTYLFGSAFYTQMAVHTTLGFIFLCIGIYASRADKGFVKAFSSASATSKMTRRLLAAVVFTPILVRWIADLGLKQDLYDADFSVLIQVMGSIVLMGAVLISTAQALYRIEKEREEARERAEAANKAKTNFLANISHEIRTPLGAVLGFSELLATDDGSSEFDPGQLSAAIKRNGDQLLRLIDDLLDVSKIDAGHLGVDKQKFSLKDFLLDVASLAQLKSKQQDIFFEIHYLTALPETVYSDSARLRQILLNVIGNAIKFNQPRGSVRMSVEFIPTHPAKLRFRISDTGPGIAREFEAKLFQPFSQGDASSTRRYGGSGLGLALSKKIANALDGDIYLDRPEGAEGSVFCVDIHPGPLEDIRLIDIAKEVRDVALAGVVESDFAIDKQAASGLLKEVCVLLIEDSPDNQELITQFLKSAGAKVDVASDGLEGIDKALHGKYDVILMDLQMPRLDGYEAVRRLRGIGYKVPIIALTAHAMKEERDRCFELGFSEHLTKPINRRQLIHAVEVFSSPIASAPFH